MSIYHLEIFEKNNKKKSTPLEKCNAKLIPINAFLFIQFYIAIKMLQRKPSQQCISNKNKFQNKTIIA